MGEADAAHKFGNCRADAQHPLLPLKIKHRLLPPFVEGVKFY
jgi:hypothetical protein